MNNYKLLTVLLFSFMLHACGGGGGGDDDGGGDPGDTAEKRLSKILIDEGNNDSIDVLIDYEYDANGNITFVRTDYGNNDEYDTVVVNEYDDNNNKIKETIWIDLATIRSNETIRTFDDRGNALTQNITDFTNGFNSFISYTYTGDKISSKTSTNASGSEYYLYLYTGNVLDIHWDTDFDGEYEYVETFNYDGAGNKVQYAIYDIDGDLSVITPFIDTFTYDDHNNVLVWSETGGTIFSRHTYTYDIQGNKLTDLETRAGASPKLIYYEYE